MLALALAVPAASAAPKTKLIGGSGGNQGALGSWDPDINANGNIVVFATQSGLIGSDANLRTDVYRRNVSRRKTKLVSRTYTGAPTSSHSNSPSTSANGRYVAFISGAGNVTPKLLSAGYQVYRRDLVSGKNKLVSTGGKGVANKNGRWPSISSGGRFITLTTQATNLTGRDTGGFYQVYLRDLLTKKTFLISQSKGVLGNGTSRQGAVSANGRFVAFESAATNLSPKDEQGVWQIFVRDRQMKKTFLISKNSNGRPGAADSWNPVMSDDGRIIAFLSFDRNLIKWGTDSNGVTDVFKYNRSRGKMSRASLNWRGKQLSGASSGQGISANGKVITFHSLATNTIKGGTNGKGHIYRRGPAASSIRLVDRNNRGHQANGSSVVPAISANGKYVAYRSSATNLGNDNNGHPDIFRTGPF